MKLYISGKITGLSPDEYLKHFADAEEFWKNKASVINPARTNATLPEGTEYEQYMKVSFLLLSFCDAIYMLDNYFDSPGALRELEYAKEHGYTILYEGDEL